MYLFGKKTSFHNCGPLAQKLWDLHRELHKVDFFNKLDTDGSMSLSREEFRDGILMAGIPMTENEIESLLNVLDKDGDGEINYRFDQSAFNLWSRDFGYAKKIGNFW